jgi:fructokinase
VQLGIDLGGTKIAAVVLDDRGGVAWEVRVPTPRGDYEGTVRAIAGIVRDAELACGRECTVGVGMPGAVSPATGLVKNANSLCLNGQSFRADLERAIGRDVRCANDANCLAVSEATDGAAAGAEVVFGVILGTGAGGGLVIAGRPVTGANAVAGEWGHNPLPWPEDAERPGPPCYCGRSGCLETFVSGPALASDFRQRGGDDVSAESVVSAAGAGDPRAAETLSVWHGRVARGLAAIINVVDPDVIVVGGGLSRIGSLYDEVPARWSQWVFSDQVATRLVPARFGDASGVRGAAWLWPRGVPC